MNAVEALLDDFRRALPPFSMRVEVYTDGDEAWDLYVHWGTEFAHGMGTTLEDALRNAWSDLRKVDPA